MMNQKSLINLLITLIIIKNNFNSRINNPTIKIRLSNQITHCENYIQCKNEY